MNRRLGVQMYLLSEFEGSGWRGAKAADRLREDGRDVAARMTLFTTFFRFLA